MKRITSILLTSFAVLTTTSAMSSAASIACVGGYQRVGSNLISTPYCQDALLAHVAKGYGMRVSAAEVRDNFNRKTEVCRLVGHDNRVREACLNDPVSGRSRH